MSLSLKIAQSKILVGIMYDLLRLPRKLLPDLGRSSPKNLFIFEDSSQNLGNECVAESSKIDWENLSRKSAMFRSDLRRSDGELVRFSQIQLVN